MKLRITVAAAAVLALTGCTSISGLDAKSEFACKAPDGVLCESMEGVYANAMAKNLPGQQVKKGGQATPPAQERQLGVLTEPIAPGTPIRSAPKILRIWIAPWEDSDGDLHEQSFVFAQVDSGRWLIEHNRRRIQDTYRPVRAPAERDTKAAADAAGIKVNPPPTQQAVPKTIQDMMNAAGAKPAMPQPSESGGEAEQ